MKEIPTDDVTFGTGRLREDGRKIHDMHLFEVKATADSKKPCGYYKYVRVVSLVKKIFGRSPWKNALSLNPGDG